MFERLNVFRPTGPAVLSLEVQAGLPADPRERGDFEVLVRHLLNRFLNNEAMSSDGESTRAVQAGYMLALPGLIYALFQFASYHQPGSLHRGYWPQVGDHFFYVIYSFVLMGVVTVCEWDLLFPDLLDVWVLSVLPIERRRLFLARVLAVGLFLGVVLVGTNFLGAIFLPLVADLPSLRMHFFAHVVSVAMAGIFTAAAGLMVQGVLLNVISERMFRRIGPLLQGGSIMVLLTVLFLYPAMVQFLEALLRSGSSAVGWFPPFWFLGIYERMLGGAAGLPVYGELAAKGWWGTGLTVALVLVTYPVAYRKRVRQLVEGSSARRSRRAGAGLLDRLLDVTILRGAQGRVVFHFVEQTLLRTQRHRVMLAVYGGLGMAFTLAGLLAFRLKGQQVGVGFVADGIRSAVPVLVFWTVMGMRTALAAPVDRRASWVFRTVRGRVSLEQLQGARMWVIVCASSISVWAVTGLLAVAPAEMLRPMTVLVQLVTAIGLSVLMTDCLFLRTIALPFTALRSSSTTEMPWAALRYFVVFPLLVIIVLKIEGWMEMSVAHVVRMVVLGLLAHLWLRWRYRLRVRELLLGSDFEDNDDPQIYQRLRLQE
ncbi:MAG: hypothetical protein JWM43_3059 [Acidobacteriaceae bacterium]|nr:hypothetical protein [Acidobacteriaceae bacterium]